MRRKENRVWCEATLRLGRLGGEEGRAKAVEPQQQGKPERAAAGKPGDGRGEAGISCCPSSTVLSFTGAPAVQWWRQSLTGGVVQGAAWQEGGVVDSVIQACCRVSAEFTNRILLRSKVAMEGFTEGFGLDLEGQVGSLFIGVQRVI